MATNAKAIRARILRLPKRGHSVAEYEDASASDPVRGRFAIADGATESSFAGRWAQLLVEGFVHSPYSEAGPSSSWLPKLQEQWATEVCGRPLPWYAENKVQQGAFATFLGLTVDQSGWLPRQCRWHAFAVGDSCLFQIRDGRLCQAFPLTRSEEFGNTPRLLGSRENLTGSLKDKQSKSRGHWRPGDRFWLMTDALAQWFLKQREGGQKPWEGLENLLQESAPEQVFPNWIEALRDSQELRNDDVTLVGVCLQ